MAVPGADEMATSGSHAAGEAGARSAPSKSNSPHQMASSGFQAVNSPSMADKSKSADPQPGPPPKSAAVTQNAPQTAQTSSGTSQPVNASASADGAGANMTETAATYGTRSRNRTGNARPNYAETEQDMEIDYSASAATTTTKKKTATDAMQSQNPADARRTHDLDRLTNGATATGSHANSPGTKEATPTAPTNPKKRKAVAASASTHTPAMSNSPGPAATRKPGTSASMARETNIMTFTKHKNCLNKKGELVADDGTKLVANGT